MTRSCHTVPALVTRGVLALACCAAASCVDSEPTDSALRLPAVASQDDGWSCGPNSAARILKHYGFDVTYDSVRSRAHEVSALPDVGIGLPPRQLAALLESYHSAARFETETSFERIRELLRERRPVIALVLLGHRDVAGVKTRILHWIALAGLDEPRDDVFFYDTRDNRRRMHSNARFVTLWDWRLDPDSWVDKILRAHTACPRSIVYIDSTPNEEEAR